VALGYRLAGLFHVAEAQPQSFPGTAKPLTRILHAMILSLAVDRGRRHYALSMKEL